MKKDNASYVKKLTSKDTRLSPARNALGVVIVYVLIGITWIVTSDLVVEWLTGNDAALIEKLQLAKGIFYVVVTALLFFFIIKKRMDLYVSTLRKLDQSNIDLSSSNDSLTKLEDRLYELAYNDRLTGLANKNRFRELVKGHLETSKGQPLGIVYVDIDNFKGVNEVKGYAAGDFLITTLAREYQAILGSKHQVFRFSDDLFVLLINGVRSRQDMDRLIAEYTKEVRRSIPIDGDDFFFTVSAGIAYYPDDGDNIETLMRHAEMALQMAKDRHPGAVVIYEPSFEKSIIEKSELSNLLHMAIENQEIKVYFQPIYDAKKHKLMAMEALLRWKEEKRGFVPPLSFIPIAEKSGQIKELTRHVVERSFAYFNELITDGAAPTPVSINLSTKLILEEGFVEYLKSAMERHRVDSQHFIFEITESLFFENFKLGIERIKFLRSLNFKVALDDFGTGYSSLSYLQQIPLDILKIDRSFILAMGSGKNEFPMIDFMINLGHALGLKVIAEGVEEIHQQEYLLERGVDGIQGYLYAKPMDAFDVTTFVMTHQKKH